MQQTLNLDPVALRYAAALRGVVPPAPETPFRYARFGAITVNEALCLAASNPEGSFQFVLPDASAVAVATARAQALRLTQCSFVTPDAPEAFAPVDIFCADLGAATAAAALSQVQTMAQQRVAPGGLFVCRYAPFPAHCDALQFMVAEFAPELPAAERLEFLHELKQLGGAYFAAHPAAATALDAALGAQQPEAFLQRYGLGAPAGSAAVQMIAALAPAQFGFLGDAAIAANYLELMVPPAAQDVLYGLRQHLLYEVIKDFATARATRCDIWVRQPATFSADSPALFGYFYFGLRDSVALPARLEKNGQTLELTPPLFQQLLTLMRLMPLTIGDVLSHPDCQGFAPADVVAAIHMLVAFGVAVPMRGSFAGLGQTNFHYPRLAGAYNQQLQREAVQEAPIFLASPVAGRPLELEVPEALVLQAVGRVGLAESADALMPELQRVAGHPALAGKVFTSGTAVAADFAENLIRDICNDQMVSWYALGVLDAA